MDRREYLKLVGAASVGVVLPGCTPTDVEKARTVTARTGPDGTFSDYDLQFFGPSEFQVVRLLADVIIPADDRSGSASEARVPEFIDFTAWDRERYRVPLRGGIAWLNQACRDSFGADFASCTDEQRLEMAERLAWPEVAADDDAPGVAFFSLMRDMTASGFYSSRMGMEDLGYMGNVAIPEWTGCAES